MDFFNDFGRQALKIVHEGKKKTMLIVRNHLQPADIEHWAELHNEKFSKIQVELYDYTNENNKIRVKFNLDPDQCVDMYDVAMMRFNAFSLDPPYYKEFKNKCSYFNYTRNPNMKAPWIISIENGDCDQNHKTDHKSNTKLSFFMSEAEFIHFVRGMKTIIDVFNYTFGSHLFLKGLNKSREAEKIDRENYAQQQNGNGNYQQTYNIPADNQTYDYPAQQQPPQVQPSMPQQRTPQQPPVQQSAAAYSNPPGWN